MDRSKILLALIFILVLALLSYKATFSFFSNQATSTNNIFAAASTFPTPTPTPCPSPSVSHLVINEVSSDGNKDEEWVEIYNPTCSAINVSGWKIEDNTSIDTLPAVSPILAHGFGVIVTTPTAVASIPSSAITIQILDDNIGNGIADLGDELHLKNASNVVQDEMSFGNDTAVYPSPAPSKPTSTQTLQRNPNGTDTENALDWHLATPTIGVINH